MLVASMAAGQQIQRAEYFIDTDPGFGMATPVPVTVPGNDLSLSFQADLSGLAQDFHMLVIRACDESGRWSTPFQQNFYITGKVSTASPDVTAVEYFIDADPGFGQATPVPVPLAGQDLPLGFQVDLSGLAQDFHTLVIRARDETGCWSTSFQQIFYVIVPVSSGSPDVTALEYFIDTDPGFGNGIPVSVAAPGRDVTAGFVVNMAGLSDGDHILYVRGRDALGRWSHTFAHAFSLNVTGSGETEAVPWFRLYPNPSDGHFMLDLTDMHFSTVTITISDMSGRSIYNRFVQGGVVPLQVDLPAGVYLLRIDAGKNCFSHKLIIQ